MQRHSFTLLLVFSISIALANDPTCSGDSVDCDLKDEDSSNVEGITSYIPDTKSQWGEYLTKIASALAEYTECPENDSNCTCYSKVIDGDLAVWTKRGGISRVDFDTAQEKIYGGVLYQIIDHKLYRSDDCTFRPRCQGVEHFILEIIHDLPDMELVVNVHDYPKSNRHRKPLPIFSFSKTADYFDIMYPAWSFWSGGPAIRTEPTGLGRWDEKRQSVTSAASKWPWEEKIPIAFFRGSRTSGERDPLVLFSRENPELVDAQYTKNQAWKSDKDTLGYPPAEIMPLEDHCQFKYLFNFRGVAASFRFRHLFLCGSLVYHVGESWIEFFYPRLKPWVHYIPVKQDLSDLHELLTFAGENDAVVQQIASRGYNTIWNYLRMDDVQCYWKELLTRYAKLISWNIERDVGTIMIS